MQNLPPAGQVVALWVSDALLGVIVAFALALIVATTPGGQHPPDAFAYAFALGLGALMLLRRRAPRSVLVLSALSTFAYYTFDYPPIGVAVPMLAALFSAAEAGLLRWSMGTAVVVYVVSMFFRIRDGVEPLGTLLGYESVTNLALFAAATAAGAALRANRVSVAQRARIEELTSAQLRRETDVQIRSERERISRELHDTVGHTLSVVALHAGVAQEAIGRDDDAAARAVEQIRVASRGSLAELRAMVGILRKGTGDDPHRPASLAAVEDLADSARATGLAVQVDVDPAVATVSSMVGATAYRVIQESLTNVIRHAQATQASVAARLDGEDLIVRVDDDGAARGAAPEAGSGLKGMTERVRLLGGTLHAEATSPRGFSVEARMPARIDG